MQFVAVDKALEKHTNTVPMTQIIQNLEKQIPAFIDLKVGAQVMLLRNRNPGKISSGLSLVNGSRGIIKKFVGSEGQRQTPPSKLLPLVEFDNGMIVTVGPVEYNFLIPGTKETVVRYQVLGT